jgi:23S rRNA (guanosine2251-2'-O)-methyltransferase
MEARDDLIWGKRAVEEKLLTGAALRRILLSDTARPSLTGRIRELAKASGVECKVVPNAKISEMARSVDHGGVIALTASVATLDLASFLALPQNRREVVFAFDGVENPRNLGMAARSLVAAGVTHILIPQAGSAQPDAVYLEASAGTGDRIAIVRVPKLADALSHLRDAGYWLFGLDGESKLTLWQHALPKPSVFVMGGEAKGMRPTVRKVLHETIAIPMRNQVESLNVAVSASLVAFEVLRRG